MISSLVSSGFRESPLREIRRGDADANSRTRQFESGKRKEIRERQESERRFPRRADAEFSSVPAQ